MDLGSFLENLLWAGAMRWLMDNGKDPSWWEIAALVRDLPRPRE